MVLSVTIATQPLAAHAQREGVAPRSIIENVMGPEGQRVNVERLFALDAQGRERVMWSRQITVEHAIFREGSLLPDGQRVQWDGLDKIIPLAKPGESTLAVVRPVAGAGRALFYEGGRGPNGEMVFVIPEADASGRPVFENGQLKTVKDQQGRLRVQFSERAEGLSLPREGTVLPSGQIQWDAKPNLRTALTEMLTRPREELAPKKVAQRAWSWAKSSRISRDLRKWFGRYDESRSRPEARDKILQDLNAEWERLVNSSPSTASTPPKEPLLQRTKKRGQAVVGEALRVSLAFYAALGMAAAINLMIFYPDDPVAWDNYLNHLADPVGYMALGGFMLASGLTYAYSPLRKMPGRTAAVANTGLALVAGALMSEVIYEFATDPDTQKCLHFSPTGQLTDGARDVTACERAAARWSSGKVADTLTVSVGRLLASSLVYVGLNAALTPVARGVQGLIAGSRLLAGKTPPTSLVGIGLNVIQISLFLGADMLQEKVVGTEYYLKRLNLSDYSWTSDELGTTLAENQWALFAEWEQLTEGAFVKTSEKVVSLIERHHHLQGSWRALIFRETAAAQANWLHKVRDYNNLVEFTRGVYRDVTSAVRDVRSGQSTLTVESAIAFQRSQDNPPNGTPELSYSPQMEFPGIDTERPVDYVLVSAICGPDPAYQPTTLDSLLSYLGRTPPVMNEDPVGWATRFHPPRLTNFDETVCDQYPRQVGPPVQIDALDTLIFTDLHGVAHRGVPSYLAAHLRPEVLKDFDGWWAQAVQPQAEAIRREFSEQYRAMLIENLYPLVTEKSYFSGWCEPTARPLPAPLVDQLTALGASAKDCPAGAAHRLANGMINSLQDEMRLYLAMYAQLLSAMRPDLVESFQTAANRLLERVGESSQYLASLGATRARTDDLANELWASGQAVLAVSAVDQGLLSIEESAPNDPFHALAPQEDLARHLVIHINASISDLIALLNILNLP